MINCLNHEIMSSTATPLGECRMKFKARGYITVQQDNDSDAQKKRDPTLGLIPSSLAEFIKTEAIIIALVTGFSYYLTYKFYSSYLSYFGVSEIFVDLELSKVIVSAAGVIILSFSIYQLASILPLRALRWLLEVIIVFPHIFFPLAFFILSMWISGYSYVSQSIAAYLIIAGSWTGISLRRKLRSGTVWSEIFQETVDQDNKFRPHFLGTAISDSRYGGVLILAVLLISVTSLLGGWAGNQTASRERDFMLLEFRDMDIAIVGTYRDQFIGVGIEQINKIASPNGSVFLIPPPSSGENLLMRSKQMHIKKFEHPKQESIKWVTLEDAWKKNVAIIRGWISVLD